MTGAIIDILRSDRHALRLMGQRVRRIGQGDLARPTPCTDWDVRQLIDHVVGGNLLFARTADNGAAEWEQRNAARVGVNPEAVYEWSVTVVADAFSRNGVLNELLELPFGRYPGQVAVAVHFVDVLVHSWDLAVATDQSAGLPEDLVQPAMEIVDFYPDRVWGDSRYFADPLAELPDELTATQQLVARLGRDPDWEPPIAERKTTEIPSEPASQPHGTSRREAAMDRHTTGRTTQGVACTLGAGETTDRIAEWRRIGQEAQVGRQQNGGQVVLTYRYTDEVAARLQALIDLESACCSFLDFRLDRDDGLLVLEVSGPPEADGVLELFASDPHG